MRSTTLCMILFSFSYQSTINFFQHGYITATEQHKPKQTWNVFTMKCEIKSCVLYLCFTLEVSQPLCTNNILQSSNWLTGLAEPGWSAFLSQRTARFRSVVERKQESMTSDTDSIHSYQFTVCPSVCCHKMSAIISAQNSFNQNS